MIEAVNSSVASASVLRASVGQISAARTVDVAPSAPVRAASVDTPQVPYISPYISVDPNYNKAVLQIRDSDTGDVVQQFPTESRLAEIRRAQAALEQRSVNRGEAQAAERAETSAPQQSQQQQPSQSQPSAARVSGDVITVQEATSAPAANVSVTPPSVASAALSAGAQSAAPAASSSVTVFA